MTRTCHPWKPRVWLTTEDGRYFFRDSLLYFLPLERGMKWYQARPTRGTVEARSRIPMGFLGSSTKDRPTTLREIDRLYEAVRQAGRLL